MKPRALLLAALLLAAACTPSDRKEQHAPQLPASRGLPAELVLVVPRGLYTGELRDTLTSILQGSTPVLPQHEPLFRLDVAYTDANLTPWRTFRSRLVVETDPKLAAPSLGVARNVYARPQIEVRIAGPNAHELALYLSAQRQRLTDLLVDHELACEAAALRRRHDPRSSDSLHALAGHRICLPTSFRATKVGRDFLWTGTNLNDRDQNFVYYTYPWNGLPLSPAGFAEHHDSVLRANIPGARPGQWMQTARIDGEPLLLARTRVINNKVVQELHGLWELRAGALGGPFVAIERIDTASRRVLVAEGFVYSPHSPKRDLLRQLEAALRTFE